MRESKAKNISAFVCNLILAMSITGLAVTSYKMDLSNYFRDHLQSRILSGQEAHTLKLFYKISGSNTTKELPHYISGGLSVSLLSERTAKEGFKNFRPDETLGEALLFF